MPETITKQLPKEEFLVRALATATTDALDAAMDHFAQCGSRMANAVDAADAQGRKQKQKRN